VEFPPPASRRQQQCYQPVALLGRFDAGWRRVSKLKRKSMPQHDGTTPDAATAAGNAPSRWGVGRSIHVVISPMTCAVPPAPLHFFLLAGYHGGTARQGRAAACSRPIPPEKLPHNHRRGRRLPELRRLLHLRRVLHRLPQPRFIRRHRRRRRRQHQRGTTAPSSSAGGAPATVLLRRKMRRESWRYMHSWLDLRSR